MRICVIGAGYVGLITSLAFAKLNNKVICVEKDIEKVNALKRGVPTIYEEGLDGLLNECLSSNNIIFTNDISLGVKTSDIIFLAVGTPEKNDGNVDMTQVNQVIIQISNYIDSYKIIVNKSTVPVGTQKDVSCLLSMKGVSPENFDVVSNPEFLREGKALHDFFNADRVVIGCDSIKARNIMKELYMPFNSEVIFTTPETAELIKYASNAFLATKISFINEIANLCDKIGADIETISYGMGLDRRISPLFLRAGIGFGGSCFPKDSKALIKIGEKYGVDFKIIKSTLEVNEEQRLLPVKILLEHYSSLDDKTITILGLSFKPETDDIREAPSIYIIKELLGRGAKIKTYDPIVSDEVKSKFSSIEYCYNSYEASTNSDCIIICTEWPEFNSLDFLKIKECMRYPIIIDGRNMLDLKSIKELGFEYYSVGRDQKNKGC
ncbi:UDP-glucose dehydrogenase family protein [Brassicibacter mesophilus]|uniref:UDP-glucose dehydrogenase family protein n=1 Tax=Brassicibacter mesophilus TaxID=745119 RepID=UPI003D22F946